MESHFDRYETSGKKEKKTGIAHSVVGEVKGRGGRFLKQVDGVLYEVDDATARTKVSHDFRTLRSTKVGDGDRVVKSVFRGKETAASKRLKEA
jgi:hypothetical protein